MPKSEGKHGTEPTRGAAARCPTRGANPPGCSGRSHGAAATRRGAKRARRGSCRNSTGRCNDGAAPILSLSYSEDPYIPTLPLSTRIFPLSPGFQAASRGLTRCARPRGSAPLPPRPPPRSSRHGLGVRGLSRFNLQDKHTGAGACSICTSTADINQQQAGSRLCPPRPPPRQPPGPLLVSFRHAVTANCHQLCNESAMGALPL